MLIWLKALKRPLKVGFAGAVLVAAASLFLPNYFNSQARILPAESKGLGGNLGGLAAAAATFGVAVPGADVTDANFVDIIQSRWMGEHLLEAECTYRIRSWRFGPEKEVKGTLYQYLEAKNLDLALRKLDKVLKVSKDTKSKIITLTVETRSPSLSQVVVKKCTRLLETFVQEKGRTRGGAKALFAANRLTEARGELSEAEEALRRFLEQNRNYMTSSDPSVRLRGLRLETELKLRQQVVTTLALNREQALMEEKNDIPVINVLDPGNLPIEKSRPTRSVMVVVAFLVLFVGVLGWEQRRHLEALFRMD